MYRSEGCWHTGAHRRAHAWRMRLFCMIVRATRLLVWRRRRPRRWLTTVQREIAVPATSVLHTRRRISDGCSTSRSQFRLPQPATARCPCLEHPATGCTGHSGRQPMQRIAAPARRLPTSSVWSCERYSPPYFKHTHPPHTIHAQAHTHAHRCDFDMLATGSFPLSRLTIRLQSARARSSGRSWHD